MVQTNDRYIMNNPLIGSNMAIIVPSYDGHLMFLKNTLSQYIKTKKYVILAYDKHTESIPSDIWSIPHSIVFKHKTWGANKRNGWLWNIIYASGIVKLFSNFEYIFTSNSDCVFNRPQGVDDIINVLGDYDLMSSSSNGTIHTCSVIWKRQPFLDFVSYLRLNLEKNIPKSHSPEVLLRDWASENKIKVKVPPLQAKYPEGHRYAGAIDHYSSYYQNSTFKNILGFKNLGGEHKWSCLEHLEPVPDRYFDLRGDGKFLNQHEKTTLLNFYITQDRRWLYKYWAEGEDSYWNRRYYPLEYYGNEPLYDDSKRKELGPPSERLGFFDRFKYNEYILKDDEYYSKWKEIIK